MGNIEGNGRSHDHTHHNKAQWNMIALSCLNWYGRKFICGVNASCKLPSKNNGMHMLNDRWFPPFHIPIRFVFYDLPSWENHLFPCFHLPPIPTNKNELMATLFSDGWQLLGILRKYTVDNTHLFYGINAVPFPPYFLYCYHLLHHSFSFHAWSFYHTNTFGFH